VLARLRFTLVSEPMAEDDDEDCVEIGYAYVSLAEILQTGRDLIGAEIPSQQPITLICVFSLLSNRLILRTFFVVLQKLLIAFMIDH